MTQEEVELIEKILSLTPNQRVMKRFGFKSEAEMVAFACAVTGTLCKLSDQGKLSLSTNLDDLADKIKDVVKMLRPSGPTPMPPSDPDIN